MGLETTNTIAGLVNSNPASTDPVYNGPNHFWLIKTVLKHIFPGAGGVGFAIPIEATETEINYLVGATDNIQSQLDYAQTQIGDLDARTLGILSRDGSTIVHVPLS